MARRTWLLGSGVAALCWLVFAPALSAGFLLWDDAENLLTNAHWRGLGFEQLRWMFTTLHLGPYQPLAWLSLALDWELWGLDPRGYHATNVLLHSVSALLCFLCAHELFARRGYAGTAFGAAAAAALFAWHPLRVESVAWVTERRDVLSGVFLFLSLRAWLAYAADERRHVAYWLAFAAFAASLLAKASALAWPLVLVALDVWVLERGALRQRIREQIPFLALAALLAVVALAGQAGSGGMARWGDHGLLSRLAQAGYGWFFYPVQTLLVAGVRPIYDLVLPLDPAQPILLVAWLGAPLLFLALCWQRRRWPAVWAAVLSYTLLVAPLLGLVQAGQQLVAARYSYLSCIPFALLAGACVARWPRLLAPAALLVTTGIGWRAHADTRAWRNDRALWTRALELDPASRVALRNLVAAVHAEGSNEEALALCAGHEGDPELENARGSALAALGRNDEALAALQHALELAHASGGDAGTPESNLAELLVRLGRAPEALPLCQARVARAPGDASAWAALGHVQTEIGDARSALSALGRALALERDLSGAWLDRGLVLNALGQPAEARSAFEEVLAVRRRLGDRALDHPDALEARMQLEHLGPAPPGGPMR